MECKVIMRILFDNWWKELKNLYTEFYPSLSLSEKDRDDWRDYYEDGFSPREAIFDEVQYD